MIVPCRVPRATGGLETETNVDHVGDGLTGLWQKEREKARSSSRDWTIGLRAPRRRPLVQCLLCGGDEVCGCDGRGGETRLGRVKGYRYVGMHDRE
jgi:hypothetical protein